MRLLVNKPDTDGASANFPYGRARDQAALVVGTPTDELLLGDVIQFFERIFALSGVVANGQPEGNQHGWQLVDSLETMITDFRFRGQELLTTATEFTNATEFIAGSSNALVSFNIRRKVFHMNMSVSQPVFFASVGLAEPGTEIFIFIDTASVWVPRFRINGSILGGFPQIRKRGVTAANADFVPTAGDVLHLVRVGTHWNLSVMP